MSVALVTMLDRARANTPYDAAGPVTAVRSFGKGEIPASPCIRSTGWPGPAERRFLFFFYFLFSIPI
jgi:hypothetical protein